MSATILSIFAKPTSPEAPPRNWSTQEIAELYRVCEHLGQAGIRVLVDTGLSDENEPWAVFEQCETGDVVVHIARIDGELIISNGISGQVYRGASFRALTDQMLADAPLALPRFGRDSNVVMHPRVVLTAFVAATVVLAELARGTNTAEAAESGGKSGEPVSDPSILDVLSRLITRDQSHLSGPGQTGSTGVAIGLAAAAAYAAQIAAKEVSTLSQGVVDGPGWLGMLLSEQAAASEIRDTALPTQIQTEADPEIGLAAAKEAKQGAEASGSELVITLGGDDGIKAIAIHADADADAENTSPAVSFTAIILGEAESLAVPPQKVVAPQASSRKQATPEKQEELARQDEQLKEIVTKVEASLLTLETEKLDLEVTEEFMASSGAIVVYRTTDNPDADDSDTAIPAEPATDKSTNLDLEGSDAVIDISTGTASETVPEPTYKLAGASGSSLNLGAGEDVVVYMGGQIEVFGFVFGEDRIAFIEDTRDPDWLADVSIVGTDVVLSGHDGGSITLRDAATSIA